MEAPADAGAGDTSTVTSIDEAMDRLNAVRRQYIKFIISGKILKLRSLLFKGITFDENIDLGTLKTQITDSLKLAITSFTNKYNKATFNDKLPDGRIDATSPPPYTDITTSMPQVIIYAGKNNCSDPDTCVPIINLGQPEEEEIGDLESEKSTNTVTLDREVGDAPGNINKKFMDSMVTLVYNCFFHKLQEGDIRYLNLLESQLRAGQFVPIQWYLDTVYETFDMGDQDEADENNKIDYISNLVSEEVGHENFNDLFFRKLKTNVHALLMVYSVLIASFNNNPKFVINFLRIRQDEDENGSCNKSHPDYNVYTRKKFDSKLVQSNAEIVVAGHQHGADNGVNYAMMYGPFTRVFVKQIPCTVVWENVKACLIDDNTLKTNYAIVAYGASGTGKTSLLIQRNNPLGEFKEKGILTLLTETLKIEETNIQVYETDNDGTYKLKNGIINSIEGHGNTFLQKLLYFMSENNTDIEKRRKTYATIYNLVSSRSHIIIDVKIGEKHFFICDFAGIEPQFERNDNFLVACAYNTWKSKPENINRPADERRDAFKKFDEMRHLELVRSQLPATNTFNSVTSSEINAFVERNKVYISDNKLLLLIKYLASTDFADNPKNGVIQKSLMMPTTSKMDTFQDAINGLVAALNGNFKHQFENLYGIGSKIFVTWYINFQTSWDKSSLYSIIRATPRSKHNGGQVYPARIYWKDVIEKISNSDYGARYNDIKSTEFNTEFMESDEDMSVVMQFRLNVFNDTSYAEFIENVERLEKWWTANSLHTNPDQVSAYKKERSREGDFIRRSLRQLEGTIQDANNEAVPKFSEYCTENICRKHNDPSANFEDCFPSKPPGDYGEDEFAKKIHEICDTEEIRYCLFGIINVSPVAKQSGTYINTFAKKIQNKEDGIQEDVQSAPSLLGTLDYMQRFTTNMRTNISCTFVWNGVGTMDNVKSEPNGSLIGKWFNMNDGARLSKLFDVPPPPQAALAAAPHPVQPPPPPVPVPVAGPPPVQRPPPPQAVPVPVAGPPPVQPPPPVPVPVAGPPRPAAPPVQAAVPDKIPFNISNKLHDLDYQIKLNGPKSVLQNIYTKAGATEYIKLLDDYGGRINKTNYPSLVNNLKELKDGLNIKKNTLKGGGAVYPFSMPEVGRWVIMVTVCAGVGTMASRRARLRSSDTEASVVAFAVGYALAMVFFAALATLDPETAPCFTPLRVVLHLAAMGVGVAAALAYVRTHAHVDVNRVHFALFLWAVAATVAI